MEELRQAHNRMLQLERDSAAAHARLRDEASAKASIGTELANAQKQLRQNEEHMQQLTAELEQARVLKVWSAWLA